MICVCIRVFFSHYFDFVFSYSHEFEHLMNKLTVRNDSSRNMRYMWFFQQCNYYVIEFLFCRLFEMKRNEFLKGEKTLKDFFLIRSELFLKFMMDKINSKFFSWLKPILNDELCMRECKLE